LARVQKRDEVRQGLFRLCAASNDQVSFGPTASLLFQEVRLGFNLRPVRQQHWFVRLRSDQDKTSEEIKEGG